MARFLKNKSASLGRAPGSLVFIGTKKMGKPQINLIQYNKTDLIEKENIDFDDIKPAISKKKVSWINIYGIHDIDLIKSFGNNFDLHPLLMEDLLNTAQRPKIEDYDNVLFISLKLLNLSEEKRINPEQIGIVISDDYLISFQEKLRYDFNPLRERIRKSKGKIRVAKSDYLLYAILDTIVDSYHSLVEKLGYQIEDLENKIIDESSKEVLEELHHYKKEINFLHKVIRPVKELVIKLQRSHSDLISKDTKPFLNDLSDITTHTLESIETYRSLLNDFQELYNNGINNRMNEIMKVLTIFASIFIPLTFVAGIYGTNFDYLPELHYKYSYFIMWGFMILIAIIMLMIFKKRKWF